MVCDPIGILLLELRHDDDFVAWLAEIAEKRLILLDSAILEGIPPRAANVRSNSILVPYIFHFILQEEKEEK